MRNIFILFGVLVLGGCASQGRPCANCGDQPERTSLLQRLGVGRIKPEMPSLPIAVPDAYIIPGTVKSTPIPQGVPAKTASKPRSRTLRYASLTEGAKR